ncbi:hypothetical protein [Dyella mobilis]|nr:hypothetical protein [Dyella mobilis]GLQ98796.1 hypothetical protein GCM10007863_32160 [Dyella mobilis]
MALIASVVITAVDPYVSHYLKNLESIKSLGLVMPSSSDYVTFLAAIGSIGGVFIGLYYAAIASVGGAIYAHVPNDLRNLLAQERYGNLYIRLLSFLTVLCLLLIALRLSGLRVNHTAILVVAISAGFGVFAFVRLGQRVFNLFDPTKLSSHIFEELRDALRLVVADGYRWQDPSFQYHAYKQASRTLETLETLVDMTAKEAHLNGAPMVDLIKDTTKFAVFYCLEKRKIPTDSKWFEQVYIHQDWYRTGDHHLSIAIETGTTISPDSKGDRQWLDDRLHKIIDECLKANAAAGRWANVISVIEHVQFYAKILVRAGCIEVGFERIRSVAELMVDALVAAPASGLDSQQTRLKLAVSDSIAALPISFALEVRQRIQALSRRDIVDRLGEIDWYSAASLYRQGFAAYSVEQLEWLAPRLAFEDAIEGEVVTPIWYQADLVMRPESEAFVKSVAVLVDQAGDLYSRLISKLNNDQSRWLAAAFSSRQWEYWNKVERQSLVWTNAWNEVIRERKLTGLPWPEFDINEVNARLVSAKNATIELMAKQICDLAFEERPESLPDYCGQFLLMTGEASLRALISSNSPLFSRLFRNYFYGCLLRFDKLRPANGQGKRFVQQIKIAASALFDLMDISGYALLHSQLHDDDKLWAVVRTTWDDYLKVESSDESRVGWLCALVGVSESGLGRLPRDILRTTWRRLVDQNLDLRFPDDGARSHPWGRRDSKHIKHPSALVRVIAADATMARYDGVDIFVACYLKGLKGADALDIRSKREDLLSDVSSESSNEVGEGESSI